MSNVAVTHLNSRPSLFNSFYTIMQLYFLKHRSDHAIHQIFSGAYSFIQNKITLNSLSVWQSWVATSSTTLLPIFFSCVPCTSYLQVLTQVLSGPASPPVPTVTSSWNFSVLPLFTFSNPTLDQNRLYAILSEAFPDPLRKKHKKYQGLLNSHSSLGYEDFPLLNFCLSHGICMFLFLQ